MLLLFGFLATAVGILQGTICLQDLWCSTGDYIMYVLKMWLPQEYSSFFFKVVKEKKIILWWFLAKSINKCSDSFLKYCARLQHMCRAAGTPETWADKPDFWKTLKSVWGTSNWKVRILPKIYDVWCVFLSDKSQWSASKCQLKSLRNRYIFLFPYLPSKCFKWAQLQAVLLFLY